MKLAPKKASKLLLAALFASCPALADSTYTVPVQPALQKVATFPIQSFSYSEQADHVHLEYDLPVELTGVENQVISLDGAEAGDTPTSLSGPHGSASCSAINQGYSCEVHMKDLRFDSENLEKRLSSISATPEELADRMQVAQAFSSDPVGVVKYVYRTTTQRTKN